MGVGWCGFLRRTLVEASVQDATGSTRSQRLGHCSGLCSEGAALHTQPFLRTGQLWDRPQFPGHFFLRKWSRQYCTPLGEIFAQLEGHSESLPLPEPMAPFVFPLWAIPFACSTVAELVTTKVDVPWTWQVVLGSQAHLSPCVLSAVQLTHRPLLSRKGCPVVVASWLL